MMDEYDQYEAECEKVRKENRNVLDGFRKYLELKKLSEKTVNKHVYNIDFYINDFLLYEEPLKPREGVNMLNSFLGYWFIRKALWASVTSIKENITSLKHFYSCLHQNGDVTSEELYEMKQDIKENKDEWLETLRAFDDPNTDLEDLW